MLTTFARDVTAQSARASRSRTASLGEPNGDPMGAPSEAIDLLVRASLGALLDERGEVDVMRLLDEVCTALGAPDPAVAISALCRLRADGAIDWEGPKISGALRISMCV